MNETRIKPILPSRLKPGDTIGIIAPASPFDQDAFDRGVGILEEMGFDVFVPEDLFHKNGYLAGTDDHRAGLVNRLFIDLAIDGIVCARGGFGSMRMLDYLDFEAIRSHPKILVGFSDATALLSALYTKSHLATFHGPMVTLLDSATQETRDHFYSALTDPGRISLSTRNGVAIQPGYAVGPVSGGNLTTICHMIGTPFQPDYDGHILVLEDRGEAPYRIDRMLSQMKLSGCIDGVSGLALGTFEDCGDPDDIYRIVGDIFQDESMPILTGFDIGHGRVNYTVPFGIPAELDTGKQMLSYSGSAII